MASYNVDLWCSHPCRGGDDCVTGDEFTTRDDALSAFGEVKAAMVRGDVQCWHTALRNVEYLIGDGPDLDLEFRNPHYNPEPDLDDWRREQAMQAGMAFGCSGYNDSLGY